MKLNIESVKQVAETAKFIGEGAHIEINSHHYISKAEAFEVVEALVNDLSLEIVDEGESEKVNSGWFGLADKRYGATIRVSLYYNLKGKVSAHA